MNRVIALCFLIGSLWTASAVEPAAPPANSPPNGASSTTPSQALTVTATISSPITKPDTPNKYILRAIEAVPSGGGYAVTKTAMANLRRSMRIDDNGSLALTPAIARPSFCSSATYLIFLSVIEEMEARGHLKLSTATKKKLLVENQADGVGVWGRWNANGPGTARLFYELKLGRNFVELSRAQPGDFLKIWWTDAVGATEKGHSVIFLGTRKDESGALSVLYWSSNIPLGFGQKAVAMSKIKHMVFSRFEHPEALNDVDRVSPKDGYLTSMLTANESFTNVPGRVGASSAAASRAKPKPGEAANR
jgi:hypothetical protein